jgi:hypothetical protein
MANTLTTQIGVALFKGYTAVDMPPVFYIPVVEFNRGASVAGKVVLTMRGGNVDDYKIGHAYCVEYTKEDREVVRVIAEVDSYGGLVQ